MADAKTEKTAKPAKAHPHGLKVGDRVYEARHDRYGEGRGVEVFCFEVRSAGAKVIKLCGRYGQYDPSHLHRTPQAAVGNLYRRAIADKESAERKARQAAETARAAQAWLDAHPATEGGHGS